MLLEFRYLVYYCLLVIYIYAKTLLGGKRIYWNHVLGLDHSCLGVSVSG